MKTYRHLITNDEGLHARIAVLLVQICRDVQCRAEVWNRGNLANGADVFAVMKLGAGKGDELEFRLEGAAEEEILLQVMRFCAENL